MSSASTNQLEGYGGGAEEGYFTAVPLYMQAPPPPSKRRTTRRRLTRYASFNRFRDSPWTLRSDSRYSYERGGPLGGILFLKQAF